MSIFEPMPLNPTAIHLTTHESAIEESRNEMGKRGTGTARNFERNGACGA